VMGMGHIPRARRRAGGRGGGWGAGGPALVRKGHPGSGGWTAGRMGMAHGAPLRGQRAARLGCPRRGLRRKRRCGGSAHRAHVRACGSTSACPKAPQSQAWRALMPPPPRRQTHRGLVFFRGPCVRRRVDRALHKVARHAGPVAAACRLAARGNRAGAAAGGACRAGAAAAAGRRVGRPARRRGAAGGRVRRLRHRRGVHGTTACHAHQATERAGRAVEPRPRAGAAATAERGGRSREPCTARSAHEWVPTALLYAATLARGFIRGMHCPSSLAPRTRISRFPLNALSCGMGESRAGCTPVSMAARGGGAGYPIPRNENLRVRRVFPTTIGLNTERTAP
jgi:hypothetical protein